MSNNIFIATRVNSPFSDNATAFTYNGKLIYLDTSTYSYKILGHDISFILHIDTEADNQLKKGQRRITIGDKDVIKLLRDSNN